MSHGYEADRTVLDCLLENAPSLGYLGILGPRSRTDRLLEDLGVEEGEVPLARTPAGLDLGADTPEEIALSIVAEILAVRKHRRGTPLVEPALDRARTDRAPQKA
jgi:xanthine/CO dehydrogenase XdhC/CoxF family maturation factor